jgi:hypothetical protein
VTETEWLAARNPLKLLTHARPTLRAREGRRKFRLFAVGCARRIWPALRQVAQRRAVEVAEQFADGQVTLDELWNAWTKARQSFPGTGRPPLADLLFSVCNSETWEAVKTWRLASSGEFDAVRGNTPAEEKRQLAGLARCVFGNPFRPVEFAPSWRTGTAVALAEQMYESRDFGAMPILADALQEAGCDSEALLSHCREPGPHARGCWVVDLVLDKS